MQVLQRQHLSDLRRLTTPRRQDRRGEPPSVGGVGSCFDNAITESFFATLEKELLALQPLQSRRNTREQVANYIDNYYNAKRRHSAAGNQSPINFELANAGQLAA